MLRPAIIIAVLALAGCSSQRVQPIGFHQYMVTAKGEQAFAKATETCEKQGRKWFALSNPPGTPADQFRFECVNSYEIVPAGGDAYRIRVFTNDIPAKHLTIPASKDKPASMEWVLDKEPADRQAMQRATEYCAKMNQVVKVTSTGFDTGTGSDMVFKCLPAATAAP
jgi:hypothetical protein